jgi:di/tricarboxylate transporter
MAATIVLVLLVLALVNFAREWLPIEVFSLLLIATLVATGVLRPDQAFLGFANSSIVMIAGVMLLTGAVVHNGAARTIAGRIENVAGGNEPKAAGFLLALVNLVSAFINNVAATAMFIPVAEGMARRFRVHRGKYLMALAFASMTGGMCTLIGTSTNVAVSGAMEQFGMKQMSLFELAPVGIPVAVVGVVYLLWVAPRILRLPPEEAAVDAYGVRGFLFELLIRPGSPLAGRSLAETELAARWSLTVLAIHRGDQRTDAPDGREILESGDLLLVEGQTASIRGLASEEGLTVKSLADPAVEELGEGPARMFEATVSYNSSLQGRTLKQTDFRRRFRLSTLAIHRQGEALVEKVGKIPLRSGDVLLLYGQEEAVRGLAAEPNMLIVEDAPLPRHAGRRAAGALFFFALTITLSAFGLLDPPTAFLAGGALVLATRCLTVEEAAGYLNLRFLVMLAGMIALGMAMEESGAARLIAERIVDLASPGGPTALVATFFLITVALTQPLNNAAAALLVLPIAVTAARTAGVDPRAFAISTALGASCSFLTPFEPACLLVYGTGRYRFFDFARVGGPLTLLAFLVAMVLIPVFWPLTPLP